MKAVEKNETEGRIIMNGNEVYEMIKEIANTSDSELEEIFGTYELDIIILNNSLEEIKSKWDKRW